MFLCTVRPKLEPRQTVGEKIDQVKQYTFQDISREKNVYTVKEDVRNLVFIL